ncbi:hypothetical protein ADL12_12960 [Streptomyces regalis]|uniref:Uncharacterized protein n=1 Tax=Streptomyces regalis TaxID=68262 RepID=A0A0X3V6W5_9ACTN|nr:hypothetical protein ADL12_12960 [Streptomyces regalis]
MSGSASSRLPWLCRVSSLSQVSRSAARFAASIQPVLICHDCEGRFASPMALLVRTQSSTSGVVAVQGVEELALVGAGAAPMCRMFVALIE